jgi:hypothetical protein
VGAGHSQRIHHLATVLRFWTYRDGTPPSTLHGWNMLGHEGFEPVRMVAIDEDWSANAFGAPRSSRT